MYSVYNKCMPLANPLLSSFGSCIIHILYRTISWPSLVRRLVIIRIGSVIRGESRVPIPVKVFLTTVFYKIFLSLPFPERLLARVDGCMFIIRA